MGVGHYENFPVASLLLPRHLRASVTIIYRFARSADDIADEGEQSAEQRLTGLQRYLDELDLLAQGLPSQEPLFRDLAKVIQQHHLPIQAFRDLISAFMQDVIRTRDRQAYETWTELLDYCARSANPIGLLMLHLYEKVEPQTIDWSNQICTALQLINFWQDVAIDLARQRSYLPLADLKAFQLQHWEIEEGHSGQRWQRFLRYQIQRSRAMLLAGAPLALHLPGRIGFELRLVVLGGLRILEKIEAVDMDIFTRRPTLTKKDWLSLLWQALHYEKKLKASLSENSIQML